MMRFSNRIKYINIGEFVVPSKSFFSLTNENRHRLYRKHRCFILARIKRIKNRNCELFVVVVVCYRLIQESCWVRRSKAYTSKYTMKNFYSLQKFFISNLVYCTVFLISHIADLCFFCLNVSHKKLLLIRKFKCWA